MSKMSLGNNNIKLLTAPSELFPDLLLLSDQILDKAFGSGKEAAIKMLRTCVLNQRVAS